jgi:hypothetical protein
MAELLFFIENHDELDNAAVVEDLIQSTRTTNSWETDRLLYVDETDDSSCTQPGDIPIRTLGGILVLADDPSPEELRADVQDLQVLTFALCDLSLSVGAEVHFELDGVFCGTIVEGEVSRTLKEGLMAPMQNRAIGGG